MLFQSWSIVVWECEQEVREGSENGARLGNTCRTEGYGNEMRYGSGTEMFQGGY